MEQIGAERLKSVGRKIGVIPRHLQMQMCSSFKNSKCSYLLNRCFKTQEKCKYFANGLMENIQNETAVHNYDMDIFRLACQLTEMFIGAINSAKHFSSLINCTQYQCANNNYAVKHYLSCFSNKVPCSY